MAVTTEDLVKKAKECGYDKCGIIPVEQMAGYADSLDEREERLPETKEFYDKFRPFADPRAQYPWVKSIIVCSFRYGRYDIPGGLDKHYAKAYLTDGRRNAASGCWKAGELFDEYLEERGVRCASSRDFGLTALRWAAMKAGIGIIRRNNFFYTERGSWNHLEAFLIGEPLEYIETCAVRPCPDGCSLCVKACPTGALCAPYTMNPAACVSALTTWSGWDLTTEPLRAKMGRWAYGCDVCQDVCPFNRGAWSGGEEFPGLSELAKYLPLTEIVEADYDTLKNIVQPAFWYIPADKVWRYKTNALNVMLNDYSPEYLPAIKKACSDEAEPVRKMAAWVLTELKKREAGGTEAE